MTRARFYRANGDLAMERAVPEVAAVFSLPEWRGMVVSVHDLRDDAPLARQPVAFTRDYVLDGCVAQRGERVAIYREPGFVQMKRTNGGPWLVAQ